MEQYTRYVGFDVPAETIVIAEARPGSARDMGSRQQNADFSG